MAGDASSHGHAPALAHYYIGNDPAKWQTEASISLRLAGEALQPGRFAPSLSYATYLGGSADDEAWSGAVDDAGNAYITGVTSSDDFPAAPQGQIAHSEPRDVFVAKFDAAGNLVYTTVLGGSGGEEGNGIAVDGMGNAYVGGETFSPDFPVLNAWQPGFAGYEDAYVFKLDPEGRLVYSTFIGGTGAEEINDIVADPVGNVYVGGEVYSDDYPLLTPWQSRVYGQTEEDGFISIFDVNGKLVYSTYIGAEARDQVFAIAVDAAGYVYGTGMTSSPGFPLVNPIQANYGGDWDDCIVFKLDPWNNQMVYSTFLGGSKWDECYGIKADDEGYAYLTGFTSSSNFPLVNPVQPALRGNTDVIVARLSPDGQSLLYSTVLGGQKEDHGMSLALDSDRNAYVAGYTISADFPLTDALQSTWRGIEDGFIFVLSRDGNLTYSSFLGGRAWDRGWEVAVDRDWIVHVTGTTESGDMPVVEAAQASNAGYSDGFYARLRLLPTPTPTPTPTPFATSTIGSAGGTFWLAYPGHLTVLTVPPGAVDADTDFVMVQAVYADAQGDLRGTNHFFTLSAFQGTQERSYFALPLEIAMGFPDVATVVKGSWMLYRLDAMTWLTDGMTITERSRGYLAGLIDRTGTFGVLGQTHVIYLPLVLR